MSVGHRQGILHDRPRGRRVYDRLGALKSMALTPIGDIGTATLSESGGAFSPDDIASLAHWYDATAITGLNDGDTVSTWSDEEGTDDLSASGAPTYKTSIQNSEPVVRYDGSDDFHQVSYGSSLSQPNHYFAVFHTRDNADGNTEYWLDGDSNNTNASRDAGDTYAMNAGGGTVSGGSVTGSWFVMTSLFDGASSYMRVSGTQEISGDPGSSSAGGLTVGARPDGNNPVDADFGEVLVYDASLSSSDEGDVESYLGDKWGITIS